MCIVMNRVSVENKDFDFFRNLNEISYRDIMETHYDGWNSEKDNSKFRLKWSEGGIEKIISAAGVIGCIWVQEFEKYNQLRELQIVPEFQGVGIGSKLVKDEISKAIESNKVLKLRVLKKNRAVNLYRRLGFSIESELETQYIMVCRT